MATTSYTPRGHAGYRCEIESPDGETLRIARAGPDAELEVRGDEALASNISLVERLDAYAANELASRRARHPKRRKEFEKAASGHRKVAENLADLIDVVAAEGEPAWCSACLERHEQRWVERRSLTPDAYLCAGCGAATTPCLWPKCQHFALRKPGSVQLGKYCAEHLHVIPAFDQLDAELGSLDQYAARLDFDAKHARRYTMLAGGASERERHVAKRYPDLLNSLDAATGTTRSHPTQATPETRGVRQGSAVLCARESRFHVRTGTANRPSPG